MGYRWPEIDEMTLPQFQELAAYWRNHPPIHLLMHPFVGYKGDERRTDDLGGLLAALGEGGGFAKAD